MTRDSISGQDHLVRILLVTAQPTAAASLQLDREALEIRQKLDGSKLGARIRVRVCRETTPAKLIDELLEARPTVIHFCGHGTGNSIELLDRDGNSRPVSADVLAHLFRALKDDLRIVSLNACNTQESASMLADIVDCVVGMESEIDDDASCAFAGRFFHALGSGFSVRSAFDVAICMLMLEHPRYQHAPKLNIRSGINSAAVFF